MSAGEPAGVNSVERPRSVTELIAEALDMYQGYPLLFLTLALVVIVPYVLIVLAATGNGPLVSSSHQSIGQAYLLLAIQTAVVNPLVSVLHIDAVRRIGEGERPKLGQVALRGLQVLPVAVASVLVATAGIALGFLALIVPGILLALRWSVVAQVAAVEHEGWIPSLRRSQELTRTHYGHIFWLLLLVGIVSAGVEGGAQAIPLGSSSGAASVAVGIAVRTIVVSLSALTLALLYFDLRARLTGTPARPPEYGDLRDLDPPAEEP